MQKSSQNLKSEAFPLSEKRKFLLASFGLFGALPLFQLFRAGRHKTPYFFIASLKGGHISELDGMNFRNKALFNALDNKMLKEKKILKTQTISSKNKISWLYIFDSENSYWKWDKAIKKMIRPVRQLPSKFQYHQTNGFLNSQRNKATILV